MERFEVWVDAPKGEVMVVFPSLLEAQAGAKVAQKLHPDVEVAINDLEKQDTIYSSAADDSIEA
jgi:hypothetical protein